MSHEGFGRDGFAAGSSGRCRAAVATGLSPVVVPAFPADAATTPRYRQGSGSLKVSLILSIGAVR